VATQVLSTRTSVMPMSGYSTGPLYRRVYVALLGIVSLLRTFLLAAPDLASVVLHGESLMLDRH
jgi:hypothetical protein